VLADIVADDKGQAGTLAKQLVGPQRARSEVAPIARAFTDVARSAAYGVLRED